MRLPAEQAAFPKAPVSEGRFFTFGVDISIIVCEKEKIKNNLLVRVN